MPMWSICEQTCTDYVPITLKMAEKLACREGFEGLPGLRYFLCSVAALFFLFVVLMSICLAEYNFL